MPASEKISQPGRALASVKRVESLATKHDEKTRPASFWCRLASSLSSDSCNNVLPEMLRVPPAPAPYLSSADLNIIIISKPQIPKLADGLFNNLKMKSGSNQDYANGHNSDRQERRRGSKRLLLDGLVDAGMGRHSKIVVGAPDSYILLLAPRIFFGVWEPIGLAQDLLENAVRMVLLLLVDLIVEEIFIGEESLRYFFAGCQVDKILIHDGG